MQRERSATKRQDYDTRIQRWVCSNNTKAADERGRAVPRIMQARCTTRVWLVVIVTILE